MTLVSVIKMDNQQKELSKYQRGVQTKQRIVQIVHDFVSDPENVQAIVDFGAGTFRQHIILYRCQQISVIFSLIIHLCI